MRVLFLTLYPDAAASPRYRVGQFLPYLRRHGVECTVAAPMSEAVWRTFSGPSRRGRPFWYHAHETPRRIAQLLTARRYDVVVLQKAILSAYLRGLPFFLRAGARRLVYDIDDAVHLAAPHALRGPWSWLEDRTQIQSILHAAALVLAGNRWLQAVAQEAGAPAEYFPTVVDSNRFVPASEGPATFRVGWMGSPGTTRDLLMLEGVLDGLRDAEVVVAGADAKKVHWPGAVLRPWRYDTEVETVQGFSVGVMPLQRQTWTQGKCALKALIYMACGVPCVATPYGAVCDIIRHGENGLFADSPAEWRDALGRLRDPALRARLGEAGRATVTERFSLEQASPRLLAFLEGLR